MGKDGAGGCFGGDENIKRKYFSNCPVLTVDAIVEKEDKYLLIKRKNPPLGWALPGGKVEVGETVEQAVIRELKEETNLDAFKVKQFKVYSDPERDPRFHAISVVFLVKNFVGEVKAADDATEFVWLSYEEILQKLDIAFDHLRIISNYRCRKQMNDEVCDKILREIKDLIGERYL
jgi:ADP-ribose pyrophosphatase YjhB (NUDIX family)